jgi:hypothetical protein
MNHLKYISDFSFTLFILCVAFTEIMQLCHHLLSHHRLNALIDTTHKLSDAVEAITMYLSSGQDSSAVNGVQFIPNYISIVCRVLAEIMARVYKLVLCHHQIS